MGGREADDACIASRSPRGLEPMISVFVDVFGVLGRRLTIIHHILRTRRGDHVQCRFRVCAGNADRLSTLRGSSSSKPHTTCTSPPSPIFWGEGAPSREIPTLSIAIHRQIRAGRMGFSTEYNRKLCSEDRPEMIVDRYPAAP